MKKIVIIILFVLFSPFVGSVNVSTNGYGQAIVLPYYTVNNQLNTLFTINNSSDDIKAVKVHFREGKEGIAVLSFNLFLAPQDMWAAGLVATPSTIANYQEQPSAAIWYGDSSCAPFLISGQEFLPYEIELESDDNNMERSREGFIEIIEMGTLDISTELGQDTFQGRYQLPLNCDALLDAYTGGVWSDQEQGKILNDSILPASGGLSATASVIDVAEGVMFAIDGVTFEQFFPAESVFHTAVGDTRIPSLADAQTKSLVMHHGAVIESDWREGYHAISAFLNKYETEHFYDLMPAVAGRSELIVSMPTKRFYATDEMPFDEVSNATQAGCVSYYKAVYDRHGYDLCGAWGCFSKADKLTPQPPPADYRFCSSVSVMQHILEGEVGGQSPSAILGSRHFDYSDVLSFESGKMQLFFHDQISTSDNGHTYTGIPVIGVALQKYTNAAAAEGLMAQYGNANPVHFKRQITTD